MRTAWPDRRTTRTRGATQAYLPRCALPTRNRVPVVDCCLHGRPRPSGTTLLSSHTDQTSAARRCASLETKGLLCCTAPLGGDGMPRQKSLITVIRELVQDEVS